MRALWLVLLAACADLPDLGVCGNGVIEEANGEACDDGKDTTTCTTTCELKCPTSATGDYVKVRTDLTTTPHEDLFCPDATFACGLDRICRQPSGLLEPASAAVSFDVRSVPVVGDFDNDEYVDLSGSSATSLLTRFGSGGAQMLATQVEQEAPSSTAPIVIFDAENPDLPSSVSVAVPTEGVALLRSDTERFAPQLDFTNMMITGEKIGIVVRDPDANLGDVLFAVDGKSTNQTINLTRIPFAFGSFPGIPTQTPAMPPCVGVAAGAWKTIAVLANGNRQSFVVVTAKDSAPSNAWHVCRYSANGNLWAQTTSLELATAAPATVVLANLDADGCDELLAQASNVVTYGRLDATAGTCDFVAPLAPVALDVGTPQILAAGQIIPGGLDEIVTGQGVYECTSATDCTVGGLARRIEPSTTLAWNDAALVDLNGDGIGDVVAARFASDDVDIVRGGASLNVYRSDTSSPVTNVVAGDFDGDRLGDAGLVETSMAGDRLVVLYGSSSGVPEAPRAMSEYGGKLKLQRLRAAKWIPSTRGIDGVDDLLVLKTQNNSTSAGLSMGDAARIMTTPRFPSTIGNPPHNIGAVVSGRFGSQDVELLTIADGGTNLTTVQLYNVKANMFAPELMETGDITPPLGSLRIAGGISNAVGITGTTDAPKLVTFSARAPQPTCTTTPLGANVREMHGIDLEGDGIDELVVYTGEFADRVVTLFDNSKCPATKLAETALKDCVDIANVGPRLYALCRGFDNHVNRLFQITNENGTFTRAAEPAEVLDGEGRFMTVGDFDGDGVIDLAVGVGIGTEGKLQTLRQCPAHDTRRCK